MPATDKHSSFLQKCVNYGRKKCYNIGTRKDMAVMFGAAASLICIGLFLGNELTCVSLFKLYNKCQCLKFDFWYYCITITILFYVLSCIFSLFTFSKIILKIFMQKVHHNFNIISLTTSISIIFQFVRTYLCKFTICWSIYLLVL
jgi:hypothetical protein